MRYVPCTLPFPSLPTLKSADVLNLQGESQIFHATTGGASALCKEMGIPFLGAVPLDPRIGIACDYGESFFDAYPESPACEGLMGIIQKLRAQMGLPPLELYEGEEEEVMEIDK